MMSLNPLGHQLPERPSGGVVFLLQDKHPRTSFCATKRDPVSVELKVLGEFRTRSWGEAMVDFGDDFTRGLKCISREKASIAV